MELGERTGEFPQGKLNNADEGELLMAIISDKQKGKVLVQFGKSIRWFGMDAAQARSLAVLLCEKANELEQPRDVLDWEKALNHFREVRKQYQDLVGVPGTNPVLALTTVFQPLAERFYKGERTEELYNSMMSVE